MTRPDLYLVRADTDRRLEIAGELRPREQPASWRRRVVAVLAGVGVAAGTTTLVWIMTQLVRWSVEVAR